MLFYDYFLLPILNHFRLSLDDFDFKQAPLSNPLTMLFWTGLYLLIVYSLQKIQFKALKLKELFFVHNVLLSAGSFLLLGLILEIVVPNYFKYGGMWTICHPNAYEKRLEFYYYVNYLFKYYELIDTVFMLLKRKDVPFLHWFHHSMTLILCYTQLEGKTSVTWLVVSLNLFVHVIMYYYYARSSVSSKPIWWKKHLTTLQIVQFVIDLIVINFCLYVRLAQDSAWGFEWPRPAWSILGKGYASFHYDASAICHGTYEAAWFGWAVINSYLILFIQFFLKTYSKKQEKKPISARNKKKD